MFSLFKDSLFNVKELKKAKNISLGKAIIYLLLLSVVLALPICFQTFQVLNSIQADGQKIAAKIPDFTIKDDKLDSADDKGFIYQTNSIIFTYDPEGKRTTQDVANDMVGNLFSIGLLKDKLVVATQSSGLTNAILGSNQLEIPYSENAMQNLTGKQVRAYIGETKLPWWLPILTLIIAIYPTLLNLFLTLVIATFIANFNARLRRLPLKFTDNLKILIFASTMPVILGTIIQFFAPTFDTGIFVMIVALFTFFQILKTFPKPDSNK